MTTRYEGKVFSRNQKVIPLESSLNAMFGQLGLLIGLVQNFKNKIFLLLLTKAGATGAMSLYS